MYVVTATPPQALTRIEMGWEYSEDYFPRQCQTIKAAQSIAQQAHERGGCNIRIIGDDGTDLPLEETSYPGVFVEFNREYVAGLTIKKYGLSNGITEEMLFWAQDACADDDEEAVALDLFTAWHAIRAYTGEIISHVSEETLAENEIPSEEAWFATSDEYAKERLAQLEADDTAEDDAH